MAASAQVCQKLGAWQTDQSQNIEEQPIGSPFEASEPESVYLSGCGSAFLSAANVYASPPLSAMLRRENCRCLSRAGSRTVL
jgi:hypothetical protein